MDKDQTKKVVVTDLKKDFVSRISSGLIDAGVDTMSTDDDATGYSTSFTDDNTSYDQKYSQCNSEKYDDSSCDQNRLLSDKHHAGAVNSIVWGALLEETAFSGIMKCCQEQTTLDSFDDDCISADSGIALSSSISVVSKDDESAGIDEDAAVEVENKAEVTDQLVVHGTNGIINVGSVEINNTPKARGIYNLPLPKAAKPQEGATKDPQAEPALSVTSSSASKSKKSSRLRMRSLAPINSLMAKKKCRALDEDSFMEDILKEIKLEEQSMNNNRQEHQNRREKEANKSGEEDGDLPEGFDDILAVAIAEEAVLQCLKENTDV